MQGQFLSVLESPPSSMSNKAIPWRVLSLPILREKKILHNSRLKPSINSHTDYESHRGKIHRIVSKSKNRSRLRVSGLVTEHTGISILKGNERKKIFLNKFWMNDKFRETTYQSLTSEKEKERNSSIPKSQLSQGQTKGNMELWLCCIINAREQRLCWNSTQLWTD